MTDIIDNYRDVSISQTSILNNRLEPLFDRLSIEKQNIRTQEISNSNQENFDNKNLERMEELKNAIEGLKQLKLTQDEISYIQDEIINLKNQNKNNINNNKSIDGIGD